MEGSLKSSKVIQLEERINDLEKQVRIILIYSLEQKKH